jgi:Beta-1,3-glucanase
MLNLKFVNLSGVPDEKVFITPFSTSTATYDVTFQGANGVTTLDKKTAQSLKAIGSSGLNISALDAGRFYISFQNQWTPPAPPASPDAEPSPVDPADAWFHTQWDKIEVTMNGAPGDQANLTSIDFVGIPMRMETFDGSANMIQQLGYPDNNHVVTGLAAKNASAAVTDTGTLDGKIVRVLGPSSSGYPSTGGWPTFGDYVNAVKAAGQKTAIKFETAFSADTDHNWRYKYDFTATVNANDNGITMTGTITSDNTVVQPGVTNPPPVTSSTLTVTFTADSGANTFLSSFIYAGAGNHDGNGVFNVNFSGDWTGFFTNSASAALDIVQRRIIGDLSVGFAYGFVLSARFKDSPSGDWFADGQTLALSDLQPNNPFYSTFENVVFQEAIGHRVYGHPFSDRLSAYHVAANVVQFRGTNITTLVVTILKQEDTTKFLRQRVNSIVARLLAFLKSLFGK